MSERFLDKVVTSTRERVAAAKSNGYMKKLRSRAEGIAENRDAYRFRDALSRLDRVNIIAEIKRASPSKGVIRGNIDVGQLAKRYENGGAAAISVLTEPEYFDGTMSDLVTAVRSVEVPVLRKDFIVDEYQVVEAAAAGASAILLIVAALSEGELCSLHSIAGEVGLDVLVEVHDQAELETATAIGSEIIGVNNRDLNSLEISLDVSRQLAALKPEGCIFIAESGISTKGEIDELRALGFDAFLIGETLMKSDDPAATLRELMI